VKLIKLTNSTKGRIASFFEHNQEDGSKVTVAFGMNGNSWEVKESINQIEKLINK